jgi:hypothetical protein
VIPLVNATSERPDADFADATVIIRLNDVLETRNVVTKSGDRVTVDVAFSDNPQNAVWATFQWSAECTDDRTTGACIMEFSRSNAGEMDASCNWTPAANPVTEFCTIVNHDPDQDTGQHSRHGEPCWDSIVDVFADLSKPAAGTAADKTAPAGFQPPEWIVLEPNLRVALILDRSVSMDRNGGSRLRGVQTGATYWVENGAVESDLLTVVWYNHDRDVVLPLVDVGSLTAGQRQNLVDSIAAQTADGATNIRDALRAGLTELLSPGTAAAVQAALLMTDGAHNSPLFSSMLEAVGEFQEANTNIYTLGVGTGSEVDRPGLETLSAETSGASWTVEDGSDSMAITTRMIEINNLIRGGIITSVAEIVPDAAPGDIPDEHQEKRPSFDEVLETLEVDSVTELIHSAKRLRGRAYVAVHEVEKGAVSATFNLSHSTALSLYLYLIAPDGKVFGPGTPGTQFVTDRAGFRLGKVSNPMGGRWTIVGYRTTPGAGGKVAAVTGVQNPLVSVTARVRSVSQAGDVELTATAAYGAEAIGARVRAIVVNQVGGWFSTQLQDLADGSYRGWLAVPDGTYQGIIEILLPEDAARAGLRHAVLHAETGERIDPFRLGNPRFRRHVPISFTAGIAPSREEPEEEVPYIEEGKKGDPGRPVRVKIESWDIPDREGASKS